MINKKLFTSGNNEYCTPKYIIDYFGPFELDLCCTPENKVCFNGCYDFENLKNAFYGSIWCNPPYSTDLQNKAVDKCIALAEAGNLVYLLIPCRMNSKRFEKLIKSKHVAAIYFPNKRIKFNDIDYAPFDCMIICLIPSVLNEEPSVTILDVDQIEKCYKEWHN